MLIYAVNKEKLITTTPLLLYRVLQ